MLGFPIGFACALGIWAFGLGVYITRHQRRESIWAAIAALSVPFSCDLGFLRRLPVVVRGLRYFILTTSQFVLSLAIAIIICQVRIAGIQKFLALLGRSSLFTFLVHRVVMQSELLFLQRRLMGARLAVALLIVTIPVCGALCWARERYKPMSATLESLGM
jgi:hypothetical protein